MYVFCLDLRGNVLISLLILFKTMFIANICKDIAKIFKWVFIVLKGIFKAIFKLLFITVDILKNPLRCVGFKETVSCKIFIVKMKWIFYKTCFRGYLRVEIHRIIINPLHVRCWMIYGDQPSCMPGWPRGQISFLQE